MKSCIALLFCCLLATGASAQKHVNPNKTNNDVRVLIESKKPYDNVASKIEGLGGTINYEFKNIDAVAATVPSDRLNAVSGFRESGRILEDRIITLEEPRIMERRGLGQVPSSHNLSIAVESAVQGFMSVAPDGFAPEEVSLTNASNFWGATGRMGEGVIIGIMDSGLSYVPSLGPPGPGSRVIGGENFVPMVPSLDDGAPAISSSNGSHGTYVATTAGADAGFCVPSDNVFAQSVRTHLPHSSIPGFAPCEALIGEPADLVPMVGQAPRAEFFALKVFNVDGVTSTSIILAAFDRAIELKEMHDAGDPNGVNIRVLNGSFGGVTLFAAEDPFFAGMINQVEAAGIVTVFSAGNKGPSGMTGGDPGTARNTLTVGATSVAAYEKILLDLIFGPGFGAFLRANDIHQTAVFSSRGPTADGRADPDIVAPGDAIFVQGADGFINIVSGTSFAAPNVAGAAALLLSEFPNATPEQIRGALLAGADPNVVEDGSGPFDQGHGFLDVYSAYQHFGAMPPSEQGNDNKNVRVNVQEAGVDIIASRGASRSSGWLLPGQRSEFFVETKATDAGLIIQVTVIAENPPEEQHPLGDLGMVAIHSAKTSSIGLTGDYRAGTPTWTGNTATFALGANDLEEGLTRVTVLGDWWNAGRIEAYVEIWADKKGLNLGQPINGMVADDQLNVHSLNVKPGTSELALTLDWSSDWSEWPTNDLDLWVYDPSGDLTLINADDDFDLDGLSIDAPERITIPDPMPGSWTLLVDGFTIWNERESYKIIVSTTAGVGKGGIASAELARPFELSEAYPNPFNPETQFTLQVRDAQNVKVQVFDLLGRRVATLHDGSLSASEVHTFRFDASDLPSGVYLYSADGESFKAGRRFMLLK